jgi:hypothetical protein
MKSKIAAAAAVLSAIALTACNNADGHRVNSGICADFKTATTAQAGAPVATTTADAAAPVDECVRRWAYSLAGSTDGADMVADAVVAACGSALSRWNQTSLSQPTTGEGVSLTTGQPSNPLAEHSIFARNRALLYVVEARAGQCAAPPVINGAPAGTTAL